MDIQILDTVAPFTFYWPTEPEPYDYVDEVLVAGGTYAGERLYVAHGERSAFGHDRRRILVYRSQNAVLAQFVGVDGYPQTHQVATYLRRPGARTYLRPDDPVPTVYRHLSVLPARTVVSGPGVIDGLVALAPESDTGALVEIALTREAAGLAHRPPSPPTPPVPPATNSPGTSSTAGAASPDRAAVVRALVAYRNSLRGEGSYTNVPAADELIQTDPLAFLIASLLNRAAQAERVWKAPYLLQQHFGHLDPAKLAAMSDAQLETVLRSLPALPRFPRQAAETIRSLCSLVVRRYGGDAAQLWQGAPVERLIDDLDSIRGVGPGIAHVTVAILIDEFGYAPSPAELRTVDVKPDVHVVRVFHRAGLIPEPTSDAAVHAARHLYPAYPGYIDLPAWLIGRAYCRPSYADCPDCPLDNVCAKVGVLA